MPDRVCAVATDHPHADQLTSIVESFHDKISTERERQLVFAALNEGFHLGWDLGTDDLDRALIEFGEITPDPFAVAERTDNDPDAEWRVLPLEEI